MERTGVCGGVGRVGEDIEDAREVKIGGKLAGSPSHPFFQELPFIEQYIIYQVLLKVFLHEIIHLTLRTLWGQCYFYLYFIKEGTEAG